MIPSPAQHLWQKNNRYTGTDTLYAVTFYEGNFIISSADKGILIMDQDGAIIAAKNPPRFPIWSLAASSDRITAGGFADYISGTMTARAATSTNGTTWRASEGVFEIPDFNGLSDPPPHITDITYNSTDGQFYGVAHSSIVRTTDGDTWERITSVGKPFSYLTAIAVGEGSLFSTGNHIDNLVTSEDGSNWFNASKVIYDISLFFDGWYGAAYGNGRYVTVGGTIWLGGDELIAYSEDGNRWTVLAIGPSEHVIRRSRLQAVTFANDVFVAVGMNASIRTSTDGEIWEARRVPSTQHLTDVAFGNGMFVAVGEGGTILTSKVPKSEPSEPLALEIWRAVELEMVTTPGSRYQVEQSDDGGMVWTTVETFEAAESRSYRCFSTRESSERLFRYRMVEG